MAGRLGFLSQGRGNFKTVLPLQYRRRYKDLKKMNFQVLQIPSLKAILPFKCKYHKNWFHHWLCYKFAGSQRVAKRRCLGLTINAEFCVKYQMSVFKTIEKHLSSVNDCLHACTVKPISATMKIVKFVHFSCTKYHGLSHENCLLLFIICSNA